MCEDDTYLFNHYTTHVADWMLPCESHNKPWKSLCPAVGCEYPFLLQSLLSYAALNLANLDSSNHDLLVVAREKYALAVAGLRHALSSGTHVSYSVILTTILKLCMSEVISGEPDEWAKHLDGAWKLFLDEQDRQPWLESELGRASTQSLCLLKIVAATNSISHRLSSHEQGALRRIGMHRINTDQAFGHTIGTSPEILLSISDIGLISTKIHSGVSTISSLSREISAILQRLTHAREQVWSQRSTQHPITQHVAQQRQFILATEIYLQRTIFNTPPSHLEPLVSEVFDNVRAVHHHHPTGNMVLWPAFIAAVEAVGPKAVAEARTWMADGSRTRGMNNRNVVYSVIEEVWHRRLRISQAVRRPPGEIKVDWRILMAELGANVLLI
ncbi:putative c6 transcription factor [Phaeomoniella chlamydospora]|uniref:Putative c6 transcription factor n=1 Tax=Phaeomoniella chlamydospora TaxID=158046 RepID=A0A0G2H8H2_PHACM|nr:putative c6 transcription factor [Phaeomoniella chlamydospora]